MPSDAVQCRIDVVVTEEKGLERAIKELKRRNVDLHRELKKRRRDGPKRSDKRRNKRWFSPQNGVVMLHTGEQVSE